MAVDRQIESSIWSNDDLRKADSMQKDEDYWSRI